MLQLSVGTNLQIPKTLRNIKTYSETRSFQQETAIKINSSTVTWLCRQMADILHCTTPVRMFNPLAGITSRYKLADSQSQTLYMKSVGKLSYAFSVAKCSSDICTYLITGFPFLLHNSDYFLDTFDTRLARHYLFKTSFYRVVNPHLYL